MLTAVFSLFYFMINVGSLMSTIITPLLREYTSYTIAFGVPAALLTVATAIFWFGNSTYIKVCTPLHPTSTPDAHNVTILGSARW